MKITMPPQVHTVLNLLSKNGFEGFVVGGCVRDSLLGRTPLDWDVTTNATPEEIKQVFSAFRIIETGIKHGTVTVLMNDMPLEITTYRIDGAYKDARRPEQVAFSRSLQDDLARRDFTINALCYNETTGLVDMYGGLDDLHNKTLRCVGDADKRFTEDALRIMRAVRFASVLGFKLEKDTAQSALRHRKTLSKIAAERIQVEFSKLICGQNAAEILRQYFPVIAVFIPEVKPLIGCQQHTPYHKYDVFEHTLYALENIKAEKKLRLVMFFHDFGKPAAKTTDKNGISHFKGHAKISATLTETILRRLKYDAKTITEVTTLVRIHDMKSAVDKITAKKRLCEIGAAHYLDLILIKQADSRAKANPHAIDYKLEIMRRLYEEIMAGNECYSLKQLAVNGDTLKGVGLRDGIAIRRALELLLKAVIEERCENEETALLQFLKEQDDTI